jgi:hypothetical protein
MSTRVTRREALKQLGAASAGLIVTNGVIRGQGADLHVAGQPVEIAVSSVSPVAVRITVRPIVDSSPAAVPFTGALVQDEFGVPRARGRSASSVARVQAGGLVVRVTDGPPTIHVENTSGRILRS